MTFEWWKASDDYTTKQLIISVPNVQENLDLEGDGYQGDVIGESTPDVIVSDIVCVIFNPFVILTCNQL